MRQGESVRAVLAPASLAIRRIALFGCLAWTALACAPSGASAQYLVVLHASSEASGGNAYADYNYPGSGTGANFLVRGSSTITPGSATDTSGTLTSAFEGSTSLGPGDITSSAYASADLATGTLNLNASDNAISSMIPNYADESSQAQFVDTLTFTVSGASPTTVTPIMVTFTIEGNFSPYSGSTSGTGALNAVDEPTLLFGAAETFYALAGGPNQSAPYVSDSDFFNWASGSGWTVLTTSSAEFVGIYDLVGPSDTVTVNFDLIAECANGFTCDYQDTGAMNLILPPGVSFTSASGVFLTGTVPEPSTWVMMLAGLAGLGVLAHRRNAGRGCPAGA